MDVMSEQTGPPSGNPPNNPTGSPTGTTEPPHGAYGGPRVTAEQMRDVDRLRRSKTDRYIAGVAGGLGRHFDVDPTVVRVVLAVLTFFGGAGVLIYGAIWLFVPEDGEDRAPIEVTPDVRRIVLLVAGVIALSIVFGTPFFGDHWGYGFPVPLLIIGLIALALYATRDQRRASRDRNQPPPPWGSAATPPTTPAPEGSAMSNTDTTRFEPGQQPSQQPGQQPGQPPPAWMPPRPPAYVPPPRPRRTGMVLFWPTLALIAIALGTLGIFDTSSEVTISAYAALAVAITGVMLLVGAFVGRPGGLIALGLASTLALVVTSIVGVANDGASVSNRELRVVPTTAATVASDYHVTTGSITLDLTEVRDVAALDGRSIDVSLNAGDVLVVVPREMNVHVDAEIRFAGQINVGDMERGGFSQSVDTTLIGSAQPNAPTLDLELDARVGQITVEQQ